MSFSRIGVAGCGLMGSGIAQVIALAGYDTVVRDLDQATVDRGIAGIRKRLDRLVEKEAITPEARDETVARIRGTTELTDFADCDLVIEAIVEDLAVKNEMWGRLEEICGADTVFASNTSSLTITEMAAPLKHPERLVGLHFFNPVPVMKLVEVVRTLATDWEIYEAVVAFVGDIGKEAVQCSDRSGFIVNRLLVPFMMDAIRAAEEGVGSIPDIDQAMMLGTGHPMGPLTLCDFVGNDTLARIGEIMFEEFREKRFAPPPLLKRMVALGYYGRKSGRGFYDYSEDPPRPISLD